MVRWGRVVRLGAVVALVAGLVPSVVAGPTGAGVTQALGGIVRSGASGTPLADHTVTLYAANPTGPVAVLDHNGFPWPDSPPPRAVRSTVPWA